MKSRVPDTVDYILAKQGNRREFVPMIIKEAAAACLVGEGVMIANALALRKAGSTEPVVDYTPPGGGEWKFELREIPSEANGIDRVWVRLT